MNDMNDDVLLCILDFMSPEDIHKINGTCRVFHETSMKYRFANLEITKQDKATKELLTLLWSVFSISNPVFETLRFLQRVGCWTVCEEGENSAVATATIHEFSPELHKEGFRPIHGIRGRPSIYKEEGRGATSRATAK